jgi:hypothetical protein
MELAVPTRWPFLGEPTLCSSVPEDIVGNYNFTVTGTSGALTHSVTLRAVTQNLTFTVNPDPIRIVNSTSPRVTTNATMTLTGVNGFSGNVSLSVTADVEAYATVYRGPIFLPLGETTSATIMATVLAEIMFGYIVSYFPCRGPGYVTISALTSAGIVSHTFATVCV